MLTKHCFGTVTSSRRVIKGRQRWQREVGEGNNQPIDGSVLEMGNWDLMKQLDRVSKRTLSCTFGGPILRLKILPQYLSKFIQTLDSELQNFNYDTSASAWCIRCNLALTLSLWAVTGHKYRWMVGLPIWGGAVGEEGLRDRTQSEGNPYYCCSRPVRGNKYRTSDSEERH